MSIPLVGYSVLSFAPQSWSARDRISRSTIFLIDDDPFDAHARRQVLGRGFRNVERTADAAESFIRLEEPEFVHKLALVVVGLHMPGIAGPDFVAELMARVPHTPILVIGRAREVASDYRIENVRFLPRSSSTSEMLQNSREMVAGNFFRVA